MTIEQLLYDTENHLDEIEKMSDAQILAFFEPILKYTRPELQEKKDNESYKPVKPHQTFDPVKEAKRQRALAMAKQLGVELKL